MVFYASNRDSADSRNRLGPGDYCMRWATLGLAKARTRKACITTGERTTSYVQQTALVTIELVMHLADLQTTILVFTSQRMRCE